MNWTEGPATWKQLRYLSQCGYKPDHALTKTEASELIRSFGGRAEQFTSLASLPAELPEIGPFQMRQAVESAKRSLQGAERDRVGCCQEAVDSAVARRQQFWCDTCRDANQMRNCSKQALELYRVRGCLFYEPTRIQVQQVLDALDSAMVSWDRDHPDLFHQTLELNFPELRRRH